MLITSRNLSDNITGSNVKDTENRMRFTREGAERLGQNIRSGMTGNTISPNRNQYRISKAAGTMAKNVADNTVELQKIMESQGDETRSEISKLLKMMMNAQKLTGDRSVRAIKEIVKQTEKITIAAGESSDDVRRLLGIDSVQKQLYGGTIGEKITSGVQGFFGVDKGASFGEGVKQAVEPSRLFGDAGFFGLGANRNKRINAIREAKIDAASNTQFSGLSSAMTDLGMTSEKDTIQKTVKNAEKVTRTPTVLTSAIDSTTESEQQTDKLDLILKELQMLNEKNFGGSGFGFGAGSLMNLAKNALRFLARRVPQIAAATALYKIGSEVAEASGPNTASDDPLQQQNRTSASDRLNQNQNNTNSVTPTASGGLIKRGSGGSVMNGPLGDEGQEYIINIDGVETQVSKEEFDSFSNKNDGYQSGNISTDASEADIRKAFGNASASVNVLPTSSGVGNLTELASQGAVQVTVPTVTNNYNNTVSGGGNSSVNVIRDTIRDNTPVIFRKALSNFV